MAHHVCYVCGENGPYYYPKQGAKAMYSCAQHSQRGQLSYSSPLCIDPGCERAGPGSAARDANYGAPGARPKDGTHCVTHAPLELVNLKGAEQRRYRKMLRAQAQAEAAAYAADQQLFSDTGLSAMAPTAEEAHAQAHGYHAQAYPGQQQQQQQAPQL